MSDSPIITREGMIRLLESVKKGTIEVMPALAKIEAWADDFAARNAIDQKRRAGIVHNSDGPRMPRIPG